MRAAVMAAVVGSGAGGITSGEVTHQFLKKRPTQSWDRLGTRCLHFTWGSRGAVDISSLGLSAVAPPAECEFILAHGTEGLGTAEGDVQLKSTEELQELMAECAALGGRPMVVANPDFVTVSGYVAASPCLRLAVRSRSSRGVWECRGHRVEAACAGT